MLLGGVINEQVKEKAAEESATDAFKDKGEGVKKAPEPEG